jgi:hypothetical protein
MLGSVALCRALPVLRAHPEALSEVNMLWLDNTGGGGGKTHHFAGK